MVSCSLASRLAAFANYRVMNAISILEEMSHLAIISVEHVRPSRETDQDCWTRLEGTMTGRLLTTWGTMAV